MNQTAPIAIGAAIYLLLPAGRQAGVAPDTIGIVLSEFYSASVEFTTVFSQPFNPRFNMPLLWSSWLRL